MRCFYINVVNDNQEDIWIKYVLKHENELTLDNIVMSINQYLINNKATDVFFEYPNILFVKQNPVSYKCYNKNSKILEFTTKDKEYSLSQTFTSYKSLKDSIYSLL